MKKLMALCLSLLMVLSMCSFTAMAEGEVDFSVIADGQPINFVTSNLNVENIGEGNTFTSSNTAVISNTGVVTRPYLKDAVVHITAGTSAYDVTVKAMTADIKAVTDFTAAEAVKLGTSGVAPFAKWYRSNGNADTAGVIKDGKLYMNINTDTNTYNRTWINYTTTAPSANGVVHFVFNTADFANFASAGVDIRLSGYKYDADGNQIGSLNNNTIARNTGTGFADYYFSTKVSDIDMSYDPNTGEFWVNGANAYNNQNLFSMGTFNTGKTAADVKRVVVTTIGFTNAAGSCGGDLSIDNFVEYQEVSEATVLATYPGASLEKYAGYLEESYVANGGSFKIGVTDDLVFTPAEALPEGTTLTWSSTDESVITNTGDIKRDLIEEKTAIITGTLTAGEMAPIVKKYTVKVLPLTIGDVTEYVDFDSYGLANGASIDSIHHWTIASGGNIQNTTVGDNSYATLNWDNDTTMSNAFVYTFQDVPSVTDAETYVINARVSVPQKPTNAITMAFTWGDQRAGTFMLGSAGWGSQELLYAGALAPGNVWHTRASNAVYLGQDGVIPTAGFVDLKYVVDIKASTVTYYVDDVFAGSVTYTSGTTEMPDFTQNLPATLQFNFRTTDPAQVYVDDIYAYTTKSLSSAISSLSDQEKVDFYKKLIDDSEIAEVSTVGAKYALNTGYAEYDPAAYGVNVNWTSNNTDYIANDGTLVKFAPLSGATATMTANITAGSASAVATKVIKVNNGTTVVKSEDFSEKSGENYVTDDAQHGNVLQHVSTNTASAQALASGVTGVNHATVGHTDRVLVEADVKYNHNPAVETSHGGGVMVYGIQGAESASVFFDFNHQTVYFHTDDAGVNATGASLGTETATTKSVRMPQELINKEGEWIHVMFDFNVLSQTYYVYADGIRLTDFPIIVGNAAKTDTDNTTIRDIKAYTSSGGGTVRLDNVVLRKFVDSAATEVNAALNAAAATYANEFLNPVLTNTSLVSKTVSTSRVDSATHATVLRFYQDTTDPYNNPGRYQWQSDGPAVTYTVDGATATEINVTSPKEITLTITATEGSVSETMTFKRKVAPAAIKAFGINWSNGAMNGMWLKGLDGTEKVIIAKYAGEQIVSARVYDLDNIDAEIMPDTTFNTSTGLLKGVGVTIPSFEAASDSLKVFVVDADGITPLSFVNDTYKD